jgi:hypothetical protein
MLTMTTVTRWATDQQKQAASEIRFSVVSKFLLEMVLVASETMTSRHDGHGTVSVDAFSYPSPSVCFANANSREAESTSTFDDPAATTQTTTTIKHLVIEEPARPPDSTFSASRRHHCCCS